MANPNLPLPPTPIMEEHRLTVGCARHVSQSLVPGATSSESDGPPWWKEVEEVFYLP